MTVGLTTTVAAGSHLALTAGYTHNAVDIPRRRIHRTARLAPTHVRVLHPPRRPCPDAYNSLDNVVSANVRLITIHRPGSDLFVVFNEERGSDNSVRDFASRGGVVKVTYLARL